MILLYNKYSYIPLFALSVLCFLMIVLFSVIKRKSTARISFVAYLSTIIIGAASFVSAVQIVWYKEQDSAYGIFACGVALAAILVIPYALVLCTFEPKEIRKLVRHSVNEEEQSTAESYAKVIESKSLQASEEESRVLQLSYEFSSKATECFSDKNGLSLLLDHVNKTIRDEVQADGGAILLVDDFEDLITVKSFDGDFPPPYKLPSDMPHKPIRVATNFKFASFPLRENIFGEVATAGKPELITNPENDARIFQNGPEEFLECGSYIMVPMKINDSVIGVIALARIHGKPVFTEENLKTAVMLSDFGTTSIKTVMSVNEIMEHNNPHLL